MTFSFKKTNWFLFWVFILLMGIAAALMGFEAYVGVLTMLIAWDIDFSTTTQ